MRQTSPRNPCFIGRNCRAFYDSKLAVTIMSAMKGSILIIMAAVLGASGVLIGAYHAHGLQAMLQQQGLAEPELADRMDQCAVAVLYQMIHALALLSVGILASRAPGRRFCTTGLLIAAGTLLFCGGIYSIVFAGNLIHWAIIPSGGMLLAAGWIVLAIETCLNRHQTN